MILCCLEYFVYACSHRASCIYKCIYDVIKSTKGVNFKLKNKICLKTIATVIITTYICIQITFITISQELSIVSEIKDCSYKTCDLSAICQKVFVAFQRALYVGVLTKQFGQSVALNLRLFFGPNLVGFSFTGQVHVLTILSIYCILRLYCTDTLQRCLEDKLVITFYSGCRRVNRGSPILQAGCKNSVLTVHCYY